MSQYRKKPVVIEAFKLGVDNMPDWFADAVTANEVILHGTSSGFDRIDDTNADICTLEGWHHANYGDYIIRGVKGELYPCKPDIFDMTYDMVDQPKTNADRIRAKSDEALAEKLYQLYCLTMEKDDGDIARLWCDGKSGCTDEHGEVECDEERHKACILRWLKGPADDE